MNKGFTLIELVGSIVILAILALIAFPAILSVLKDTQSKVDDSVRNVIKSAAEEYVNDNLDTYRKSSTFNRKTIYVKNLRDNGYIEDSFYEKYCEVKNDKVIVTVDLGKDKYIYTYEENTSDSGCQ